MAAEFVCVGTGGDQLVRLVSAQKGQQIGLTGALNLQFGCVRHGINSFEIEQAQTFLSALV